MLNNKTSNMTKYRLKKDTPFDKAGTILTKGTDPEYNNEDCLENETTTYVLSCIENFDEWFEKIDEPKWTDAEIKIFARCYHLNHPDFPNVNEYFEQWTRLHKEIPKP